VALLEAALADAHSELAEAARQAEERKEAQRRQRKLAETERGWAAEVASSTQQKLIAAADREAALQARIDELESNVAGALGGERGLRDRAERAEAAVEAAKEMAEAKELAARNLAEAAEGAQREREAALAREAALEQQVAALREEMAAAGAAEEEKRQAARMQRRLADAQAAEVAASVQAKLVAAAEREARARARPLSSSVPPPPRVPAPRSHCGAQPPRLWLHLHLHTCSPVFALRCVPGGAAEARGAAQRATAARKPAGSKRIPPPS
jgi:hypothetical protein